VKAVLTRKELRVLDKEFGVRDEFVVGLEGAGVAGAAVRTLGQVAGRRIMIVSGKGWNGVDGRQAGAALRALGASVEVVSARQPPPLPSADLVIDAAYGIGFHGSYQAPDTRGAPVVAVDLPTGLDPDTGLACPGAVRADVTVTMGALKPGLLLGDGPELAGAIEVVGLGMDLSGARAYLVEDEDVAARRPVPTSAARAWPALLQVKADASRRRLPDQAWRERALRVMEHAPALAVRSEMRDDDAGALLRDLVRRAEVPLFLEGEGLRTWGDPRRLAAAIASRIWSTTLVVSEGELGWLLEGRADADLLSAARSAALRFDAVVTVLGPVTVVAEPCGQVLLARAGQGTGRGPASWRILQLAGVFAGLNVDVRWASAAAAHLLGMAAGPPWLQSIPRERTLTVAPGREVDSLDPDPSLGLGTNGAGPLDWLARPVPDDAPHGLRRR
jgi:ADP-dependent NAD(P)H-hydrate dehydratase / NAD(P)H-hydrate epimerase